MRKRCCSHHVLDRLDGTYIINVDFSLPESNTAITGAELLQLAESRVSPLLFGLSLPESLKDAALKRLDVDDAESFRRTEFARELALSKLMDYVAAIADELNEDPLVVEKFDGRVFLHRIQERQFAFMVEDLFPLLISKETGKISKNMIHTSLAAVDIQIRTFPYSEIPRLTEILLKHEAEAEEELGQEQFAQLYRSVLQEMADALKTKPYVVIQNIKIISEVKLRKVLDSEDKLNVIVEKIFEQLRNIHSDTKKILDIVRAYLEENGTELGLMSPKAEKNMTKVYDAAFRNVADITVPSMLENDDVQMIVVKILDNIAELLEENPIMHFYKDRSSRC